MLVCCYYVVAWLQAGRDPREGTVVTRYDAPRGLSPASLRYVWKQRFDDRAFWAALLNLVAKRRAVLEVASGTTIVRPLEDNRAKLEPLSSEELILFRRVKLRKRGRPVPMTLLDSATALAAGEMANDVRLRVSGRLLRDNAEYVTVGAGLSLVAIIFAAWPTSWKHWMTLVLVAGLVVPPSFYLPFLGLRIRDLLVAVWRTPQRILFARIVPLILIAVPCLLAVFLGMLFLQAILGWPAVLATVAMVLLNIGFLEWMKAPTLEGRKLLDEIEGFRHFLLSVEQMPRNWIDHPDVAVDNYEKYLPYAIALEIEQKWSDKFVAVASTDQHRAFEVYAHSYYLGMWDGKPVEVVVGPDARRR